MTTNELRPLVLESLGPRPMLISSIIDAVRSRGIRANLFADLSQNDALKVVDVVWQLIAEGLVAPGYDGANPAHHEYVHLTEYGGQAQDEGRLAVHDPDGYLRRLQGRAALDETTVRYVTEALQCYRYRLYFACAVMLGAASEQVLLIVSEAMARHLTGDEAGRYRRATENKSARVRYDELMKRLEPRKPRLPSDIRENLHADWHGICNLIRKTRNDARHPALRGVEREDVLGLLYTFPAYAERALLLAQHLSAHADQEDGSG